jgi:hypothetical protein
VSALFSFALVGDGTSDRALIPVLEWSLRRLRPRIRYREFGFVGRGGQNLTDTMHEAGHRYRPDLLFVHRDAERVPHAERLAEIPTEGGGIVRVVPVRMTEAWLLIDEDALRKAADDPNGRVPLDLPKPGQLESIVDPKQLLRDLIVRASGRSGRRLRHLKRDLGARIQRIAQLITDFSALDSASAFRAFETELAVTLDRLDPRI